MNENIVKIDYKDKEIYLVKTAHVSKNSRQDVIDCVNEVNPDSICIELDAQRYETMKNKNGWRDTDIKDVIKNGQVGYLLVNVILSSFQRRMAKQMDTSTGGEMVEGIKIAEERNLELVLADRNIKLTFSRIWSKLGLWEKCKLLATIVVSIFDNEEISEEELNSLKQSDALDAALKEVSKEFPMVKEILVDERDKYLATKIKNAKGNKIVAIIGAAHCSGIVKHINEDFDISQFEQIKPKSLFSKSLKWLIPVTIIGIIAYTLFVNRDVGMSQIKSWVLWNGCLSAVGVVLAAGHPLAILTAFIMAPITSLNPLIAAGFFAGMVQAYISSPKVKDFEDLADDTMSFKGFFKNKVTRVLLVFMLANIFSSIGTFISGLDIVKSFLGVL